MSKIKTILDIEVERRHLSMKRKFQNGADQLVSNRSRLLASSSAAQYVFDTGMLFFFIFYAFASVSGIIIIVKDISSECRHWVGNMEISVRSLYLAYFVSTRLEGLSSQLMSILEKKHFYLIDFWYQQPLQCSVVSNFKITSPCVSLFRCVDACTVACPDKAEK